MPEKRTMQRARTAKRRGKSASTQAGQFVKEELRHLRSGKHGAKSTKQAIAIGLNKARRSGVKVKRKRSSSHTSARRGGSRSRRSSSR